jgi:hypothetical protein
MAKCTIVVSETISQELQQDIIKLAVLRNSLFRTANAYKRLREEVSAKQPVEFRPIKNRRCLRNSRNALSRSILANDCAAPWSVCRKGVCNRARLIAALVELHAGRRNRRRWATI